MATEPGHQVFDTFSAVIHEGSWFGQDHFMAGEPPSAEDRLGPALTQANIGPLGDEIDEPESHVVSGGGIARAGIP